MAKDPAFLFYYKDWLATTRFMKSDDKGYFMDLLCLQAEYWSIPEEIITEAIPAENWQRLRKKFTRNRQGFHNEMQREKLEKRRKYVDSRKKNGNLGGRPRKPTNNHMDNHMSNLPENATVNGNGSVNIEKELLDKDLKLTPEQLQDDDNFDWKNGEQK